MNLNQIKRATAWGTRSWTLVLAAASLAVAVQSPAATFYVSQSSTNPSSPYSTWDTAAHNIQVAVDAAGEGDAVLVAAGTFALTNQVSVTKGILLRGDAGPGQTTLDGQWNGRCLWIANSNAVVDGFTMTRGHEMDGSGLAGGVLMTGGTLTNCVVEKGGGPFADRLVHCSDGGLITGCTLDGQLHAYAAQGAGVYLIGSELRNSTISGMLDGLHYGGADDGAGVYAISSVISGCAITRNYAHYTGGGAYLDGCLMDRCIVSDNTVGVYLINPAGRGGGVFATNSVIRNSLIAGNVASSGYDPATDAVGGLPGLGGGLYLRESRVIDCTVTGNQADAGEGASGGGGIYVEGNDGGGGNSAIRNSIIYFNSATSGANWYWNDPLPPVYQPQLIGEAPFAYNCTTPDPGGIGLGNTVEDPQFVDPTNANYRLAPASPCLDAGFNEAWMDGAYDLDGNQRIENRTVDMGAYESTYLLSSRPVLLRGRLGLRTVISAPFK